MNKAVFLLISVLTIVSIVGAQPKALTLDQSIQIALQQNLSIRQAENNFNSAQSGVLSAYGTYLPSLSISGGWTRTQTERPASEQLVGGVPLSLPATCASCASHQEKSQEGQTSQSQPDS